MKSVNPSDNRRGFKDGDGMLIEAEKPFILIRRARIIVNALFTHISGGLSFKVAESKLNKRFRKAHYLNPRGTDISMVHVVNVLCQRTRMVSRHPNGIEVNSMIKRTP